MTVIEVEQRQQIAEGHEAAVELKQTTWGGFVQPAQRSTGAPPGHGARLAVRKFGGAINKLADS